MISDEYVKQLFQHSRISVVKYWDPNKPLGTQFYRGIRQHIWENQHPGGCNRHLSVFEEFNIIPRYCFNCYKVYFEPQNVVDLFKLMVVFDQLQLPRDNTRKCIVETREQISGAYKGFIYCRGVEEGKEILEMTQKVVSEEIPNKIPATLKRGCSEYPLAYPEYAQVRQGEPAMEYQEEWQEYEDLADKNLVVNTQSFMSDSYNSSSFTLKDAGIMLAWIKYAAAIGDLSYQKLSGGAVHPFPDLKRPSQFHPVGEA